MARITVVTNSILPRQEAFLVDAPTPTTSPHRWIQAKPESTDGLVGSAVGAGWPLGWCVCAGRRVLGRAGLGCGAGAGWWRVGFGCAARGAQRRVR